MRVFKSKNPSYEYLRKKWVSKHKHTTQNLIDKHLLHVTLGSLGGLMLLTTPALAVPTQQLLAQPTVSITTASSKNAVLAQALKDKLPKEFRNLNAAEEREVASIIDDNLKIKVEAQLNGKRLNRTYGMIGGEQHLYRYPGDNLYAHAKSAADWAMYSEAGIAPHLGAWGYFAPSKEAFTSVDEQRERYYIAVQTFLSPGFAERTAEYRDFYKFRKMLLVNPKTGQAVVTVIGDAGPAEWTGKHLGGSPEVVHELGLGGGPRRGEVLYFFVDDPENKVPLGPIKVSQVES